MPLRSRTSTPHLSTLAVLALLGAWPGDAAPAAAQLIGLRSVPVASGDQFLVLPSARMGMGGVAIAVDDPWLDPFVNPAKGGRLEESAFFLAPTVYGISGDNGAGRTLPLALLLSGNAWFGGGSLALQQIENDAASQIWFPGTVLWDGPPRRLDESAARNVYVHGLLGRLLGERLALGGSVAFAALDAVDGVDLLYQGSDGVDQNGSAVDARLGLAGSTRGGARWETLVLFHRQEMTHDVRYLEWVMDQETEQWTLSSRIQTEREDTRTWGLHTGLDAPVGDRGWRVGSALTLNRKTHPKIPNYQIQDIPRDPGETWAFDLGLGLARTTGPVELGVDVVFEPIWSDTWSVADTAIELAGGGRIEPGGKVVENGFFFSNVHLRVGAGVERKRWGAQLGVEASSYAYALEQFDNAAGTRREQDEAWMEWSPSWGAAVLFSDVEVRYSGRLTTGTGRPGVAFTGARAEALAEADFIIAPQGPLTLQDATVWTHQVAVRLPIR